MLLNVGLYCPYCASKMQMSSKHQRIAVTRSVRLRSVMAHPYQRAIFDLQEIEKIKFLLQSKVVNNIFKTLLINIFKFIIYNYFVHFENSNWYNMRLNF